MTISGIHAKEVEGPKVVGKVEPPKKEAGYSGEL